MSLDSYIHAVPSQELEREFRDEMADLKKTHLLQG
jgi:hypothetical protein